MRFAKIVYWTAGIWGLVIITPLFFMFNVIGRQDPPRITHPGFYYGFATTALAWQIAFLVIGSDPVRLRPLMIPSVIEKFGYGATVLVLFLGQRMRLGDLLLAGVDFLLGILFFVAFYRTRVKTQTLQQA